MNDTIIERASVDSSCLASVGYAESAQTLEVEFRSGAVYRYLRVRAEIHDSLLRSASKGAYLNRFIKGRHDVVLWSAAPGSAG